MTLPKIVVSKKTLSEVKADMLIIFAGQDKKGKLTCDKALKSLLPDKLSAEDFSGKAGEKLILYPPYMAGIKNSEIGKILVIGLGNLQTNFQDGELQERFRIAGGNIAQLCVKGKTKQIVITVPALKKTPRGEFAEYLLEGICLGTYQFFKYKSKQEKSYTGLKKISFLSKSEQQEIRKSANRALISSSAGCCARNMANEPGNCWTPKNFAEFGRSISNKYDLQCEILEKSHMTKLGMGGILAVNQGSHEAPKLVCLDYAPDNSKETIMLVGKGLTFDSGGISLKPAQGMMDMKYDMCGGAAVISAMEAIAKEQPDVRVVCLVPATDNMNGGGAVKPGDIITHFGGITSEIENTDAEGRLILADALAYGIKKYKPDCVIDLATLTGAVVLALGHHHSGIMSNSKKLVHSLISAGNRAGEPLWQLPLGTNYAKQIKSKVADIKNTGGRPGGSITAAEYLHKFVGDIPWAHLDIAGTAWDFTDKSYIPKGPSGIGTRTLVEFVRSWKSGCLKK